MERFKKVYQQGAIDVVEIWIDTETGVNYVFHRNGNAAGFTPLLDKEGKPGDAVENQVCNLNLRICNLDVVECPRQCRYT